MKYKSPQVEEYPDTPDAPKRKLDQRDSETATGEGSLEAENEQPPSKASKSSGKAAAEEDDVIQENDEEFEDEELEDDIEEEEGDEGLPEDEDAEGEEDYEGEEKEEDASSKPKLEKVVDEFGRTPLHGTAIAEGHLESSPETLLAMAIDAMLKSRPISHDLSERAVKKVIEVGYHDIQKLGESSWEERTMVLKDGGYNRYREQGATNLGDLAELITEKYDGDLNNLLKKAHNDRDETRQLIKEIKGLGDLGADLFFNNVQSVWPSMAPFMDGRSLQTADKAGISTDLDAIYADLGHDSTRMSRLANGFRIVNIAVGVLMVLGGIAQFFPASMSTIIVGVYVIIFGTIVGGLEFLPNVPDYVYRYASFLFSFLGRGAFYIFVGSIMLHDHWFRYIAGSIIGFIGLGYLALEFIPSIEPPSNMREADQSWGAEQV
ncbi:hypothetical protein BO94DRAFT_453140 [Aspergillus sclerotioniger CBS 115572]|uniref:Uncharacterized protein n=1 Tax=Aspergillus sclerotioniger CBS 115572 TaxID=1450535 RepID=A0A317XDA6_9EURO|nr:hypothetical protein BO94DRAFT_453140 [Aspergillus sclerotioniger CBS 115572]PWY96606.1 hypothetical protein BO94DRAFT_453140 [Aspergillus sclerotioniger CBS 115572]